MAAPARPLYVIKRGITTGYVKDNSSETELLWAKAEGLVAEWYGGPYIDIRNTLGPDPDETFYAINVWDYERDQPRYPFTSAVLVNRFAHFLQEREVQL